MTMQTNQTLLSFQNTVPAPHQDIRFHSMETDILISQASLQERLLLGDSQQERVISHHSPPGSRAELSPHPRLVWPNPFWGTGSLTPQATFLAHHLRCWLGGHPSHLASLPGCHCQPPLAAFGHQWGKRTTNTRQRAQ